MILAKQRVIDLNISLAIPLSDGGDNYRTYVRNKKRTKEIIII